VTESVTRAFADSGTPEPESGSWLSSDLPTDLLQAASRRLVVFMYSIAAIETFYLALYIVALSAHSRASAEINAIIVIAVSVLLARHLRQPHAYWRVMSLGFAYEILVCYSLAFMEYWGPEMALKPPDRISWICVVIVFFPLLVPARPLPTLIGSTFAALMAPAAMATAVAGGQQSWPSFEVALALFLPPFLCAAMACVPAYVMTGMSSVVRRARHLGSYELVERLGQGGMGTVWRARHRMLVRPAAVKLIRTRARHHEAPDVQLVQRFTQEARATAALESPHTVDVYDFGVSDQGALYIVMELLRGIDLNQLVQRFGRLPPERAIDLLMQACDSLDDAHRSGLVHRDIKPANIFVTQKARRFDFVKVLDFGLVAVAVSQSGEQSGLVGTPAFMPPEIVRGDLCCDHRADLYALGCVAYWLLTGSLVFDETDTRALLAAHAEREPLAPSDLLDEPLPGELDEIVVACLAKRPEERPQTAMALKTRLEQVSLQASWSDSHAESWWREHLPDLLHEPELPAPQVLPREADGAA